MNDFGNPARQILETAVFSDLGRAPVERLVLPDGLPQGLKALTEAREIRDHLRAQTSMRRQAAQNGLDAAFR